MEKSYKEGDCPPTKDFYYALGIVKGEFDHHLWINKKEAEKFYKKPDHTLIKGWTIELFNEIKFAERWEKVYSLCKKVVEEAKRKKLSLEEISSKLPDNIEPQI